MRLVPSGQPFDGFKQLHGGLHPLNSIRLLNPTIAGELRSEFRRCDGRGGILLFNCKFAVKHGLLNQGLSAYARAFAGFLGSLNYVGLNPFADPPHQQLTFPLLHGVMLCVANHGPHSGAHTEPALQVSVCNFGLQVRKLCPKLRGGGRLSRRG